uniref:Alpha-type protein kinase domain-containing protein n=1 Tax=Oryzias melastigma TaxID=30732 RepID=A0A3B3CQC0_ORYME
MEVGDLLAECARTAAERSASRSEAHRLQFCSCRDSLSAELGSLLQEAMDMKWPFVPEKWQFKQLIGPSDKTNLSNLIREHLPKLLTLLKASIMFDEAPTALAVIFLVDRFLYWTDQSSQLLKIARLLHKAHPDTPIAPQLVIRQSRVYLNSGKLQKAEFILSSLIKNCGTTGCWSYHSDSDRALVQAVSVQVRGTVLQKLGLWREAAELIWASLVGFYALPQPDRKGIGTSLGILANILVSMNDEDFHSFRTNPDIRFERILGDESQRLLSAALAAKMAVISSQYTSLYVLTNVILNGKEIVGCITVEPFILGNFVKLTNNTRKKVESLSATKYGIAFGHFTYLLSKRQEVVVDLQGWVTANGKGLTYLTDPQIHSTRTRRGPSDFAGSGIRCFLREQHGPKCNEICQRLKLPPLDPQTALL